MGSNRSLNAEEEKFYKDMIDRENRHRLAWFTKHRADLIQQQEEQFLEEQKKKAEQQANKKEKWKLGRKHGEEVPATQEEPEMVTDVMRPVEEDVRNLIYTGTSQTGGGHTKYLKVRTEKDPRDKYFFAECKNMEYGWMLDERGGGGMESQGTSQYGRHAVVKKSFYRRGGVHSDPSSNRLPINMTAPFPMPFI